MKKSLILGLVAILGFATAQFPALPGAAAKFNAKSFDSSIAGPIGGVKVPYLELVNYYGYVKPGAAPDAVVGGKKTYYLYVWVPLAANEMGVRMISPWKAEYAKPNVKKDFVSSMWAEGEKDTANFFDTWISLERSTILDATKIKSDVASATWFKFGDNDDSSELPANPAGNKYNSVLRYTSQISDPLKALLRGLYRIGFTTYKVGEVQGTFFAQVGFSVKIPGVIIGTDLEAIQKQAVADEEKAKSKVKK